MSNGQDNVDGKHPTHEQQRIYAPDAEEAFLGSLLIAPEQLQYVDLEPAEIYLVRHRWIYQAMRRLESAGRQADQITIADELERGGHLEKIGGPAALVKLATRVPTSLHVQEYAGIIRDRARRRALLELGSELAKVAYDPKADVELTLAELISRVDRTLSTQAGAVHWSQYLGEAYDEIEERANDPRDIWGLPTGFAKLDKILGGLQLSELTLLAGPPGVGKSILATQICTQMAKENPGAIYSLEMLGRSVARRVMSHYSGITTRAMKSGHMEDADWPTLTGTLEELATLPVFMSDKSSWTLTGLRADLARLKAQEGIRWFLVDYLFLMEGAPGTNEIEQTQFISKSLKQICRDLELAGFAIHSMVKAGQSGVPSLRDMRGSGQVGHDADVVAFLTKYVKIEGEPVEVTQNKHSIAIMWFEKVREGDQPNRYLYFTMKPGFPSFAPTFIESEGAPAQVRLPEHELEDWTV